VTVKYFFHS